MIDRRSFLKSSSALCLSLGGGLTVSCLAPTPARAEYVTLILVAVAMIAGAIAAHNRRDVGAILAEAQRRQNAIMIKQLASLQDGMSTLITQNQKVYEKLAELPFETNAIRYRGMLVGALLDYQEETSKDDIVKLSLQRRLTGAEAARVQSVVSKLRSARNELIGSGLPLDPLLGMAFCSSCMAEIQGLNILSDRSALANVVDRTRNVLDASLKNLPGSAGGVLASCEKELAEQIKRVAENPVWKTGEVGRAAIALDVQDYTPGKEAYDVEMGGRGRGPDHDIFPTRHVPAVPPRIGDLVRIWSDVSIRRINPLDDQQIRERLSEETIKNFQNTPESERFFLEQVEYKEADRHEIRNPGQAAPAVPKIPQKISVDLRGAKIAEPFLNAASGNPLWTAQADLVNNPRTGLRLMVDQTNLIRARREVAAQAVDTIKSTIAMLDVIRSA
jgi:hypothetical protein